MLLKAMVNPVTDLSLSLYDGILYGKLRIFKESGKNREVISR
jgi:hypothetical protein